MRSIFFFFFNAERQDVAGMVVRSPGRCHSKSSRTKVDSNQGEERTRGRQCDFINMTEDIVSLQLLQRFSTAERPAVFCLGVKN